MRNLEANFQMYQRYQNEQEVQIEALKRELEEKDTEIEKIIAQVETLLA